MTVNNKKTGSVLVVGGGIAGIQASLDLADSGYKVYLVESKPAIGGHMSQLDKTFPTNDCAMCTLSPKLVECGTHPNVDILPLSELESVTGEAGNFKVTVNKKARHVDSEKCTGCGECVQNCPVKYEIYKMPMRAIEYELSSDEKQKTDKILSTHVDTEGPLMPVLQDVNRAFGYLPQNILRYLSEQIDVPISLIYRIVTFYSAFSMEPKGRHTISLCMGTTCYVRGGDKILDILQETLGIEPGETTKDLNFTLETVRCLGCCSLAPVLTIDGETFGNLDGGKALALLKNYE